MPYHRVTDVAKLHALLDAVMVIESDLDLSSLLDRIVTAARTLARARYGALGVVDPDGTHLERFVHSGMSAEQVREIGSLPSGRGVLGLLVRSPESIRVSTIAEHPASVGFPDGHPPMGSFLGVPVRVRGQVFGNLYLTEKIDGGEFTEEDEQLVQALATAAGIAVENARLHAKVRQLSLAEDRERIARDLHDTVIQRIFAVGLSLQAMEGAVPPATQERLHSAIDDLDATIRQVRTTIFALDPPPVATGGLRASVIETCRVAARGLGTEPAIRFAGAVDAVSRSVEDDAVAVLRESLANTARHAGAANVTVEVARHDGRLRVAVVDDGKGFERTQVVAGHGLVNMRRRAEQRGGTVQVESIAGAGTSVVWEVPV